MPQAQTNRFTAELLAQRLATNKSLASENPGLAPRRPVAASLPELDVSTAKGKPRGRKGPNKTEAEFGLILKKQIDSGEIMRFDFEGITLRWPDGMVYTPDYHVILPPNRENQYWSINRFIEIKGAHIWPKDLVKFRAARACWPMFEFRMWQKTRDGWSQVL